MIPNMMPVIEEQLREKDKEIERLKSRLEEYQEYVEINLKEIERLKKREQECIDHYLVQCKYASEMESKYIIANNIINELEKRLISDKKFFEDLYKKSQLSEEEFKKQCSYTIGSYDHCVEILNKLQELKGVDKE